VLLIVNSRTESKSIISPGLIIDFASVRDGLIIDFWDTHSYDSIRDATHFGDADADSAEGPPNLRASLSLDQETNRKSMADPLQHRHSRVTLYKMHFLRLEESQR